MIERVETGEALVIIGPDATEVGEAVRAATDGSGRVAAMVGAPEAAAVRAALDEMRNELFST